MSTSGNSKPASLDALLSANRERFDQLYTRQMQGGAVIKPPAGNASPAAPSADHSDPRAAAPVAGAADSVIAELNKQFGFDWSAEIVERRAVDGRAVVTCDLKAGGDVRSATGSSRIDQDRGGDQDAAFDRAHAKALKKAAEQIGSAPAATTADRKTDPATAAPVDAATTNRFRVAVANVRNEMATVLDRLTVSPALAGTGAAAAMIMDGRGQMISGQSGSFLGHMLGSQGLGFAPGDVVLQSDPYASAGATGNLRTWLVIAPVHSGTDLIGFVSMRGQMTDVGGTAQGAGAADASSIFAEGVRIPPVKIHEDGTLNEGVLDLILANSRAPESNRSDLMALIAACRAGAAQLAHLCNRMGNEVFHRASAGLRQQTKDAFRKLITAFVPEEPQSFEDVVDDDGCGNGPFSLRLTVWREDDHAYFDWTGTSAQAPGPVNFFLHVGSAKMFVGQYLTRHLGPGAVSDDGFYDLIHVTLPPGTLLKPNDPAALGHGDHTRDRQLEVLSAATGRHLPRQLEAAGSGATPVFIYSGNGFRLSDPVHGGAPASPNGDGRDGRGGAEGPATGSFEDLEADYPVLIEAHRSVADTGGAGMHRGGNATEKIYRLLEAGHVSIHDDRHASRPWGVNGGKPGARSKKWIERADGGREALPSKVEGLAVQPGDRVIFRTAGGGGCGDPRSRDPELVRQEVASGLLSVEAAANGYGVVVDRKTLKMDQRATEELRGGPMRDAKTPRLFDRGE